MRGKLTIFFAVLVLTTVLVPANASADDIFPNTPSWVVSDYVLWELFDYIDNGSSWISYTTDDGVFTQRHINLYVDDFGTTNIYFNLERPLGRAQEDGTYYSEYISYIETPQVLRGNSSNGAATISDPLSLNMPLPLTYEGNSDDVLDYEQIRQSGDIQILKNYIETNPTTMYLGVQFDPATGGPYAPMYSLASDYIQFGRLLYDISSNHSKLSVVLFGGSLLKLDDPVRLESITLKSGSVLDLSGMTEGNLDSKLKTDIIAEPGTEIILPADLRDAKVNSFIKKFSLHKVNGLIISQ